MNLEIPKFEIKKAARVLSTAGIILTTACTPVEGVVQSTSTPSLTPEAKPTIPANLGEFRTGLGRVRWRNNSTAYFDAQATQILYETMEVFGRQRRGFDIQMFTNTIIDNEIIYVIPVLKPYSTRTLTLISATASLLPGAKEGIIEQVGVSDSFLRVYAGKQELPANLAHLNPEGVSNRYLYLVACQATLEMIASRPVSLQAADEQVQRAATLSGCNILSLALDAKAQDIPYGEYLGRIRQLGTIFDLSLSIGYTLSALNPGEYNRLPALKPIRLKPILPPKPM